MERDRVVELIAEMLEVGTLEENTELTKINEWDSMSALALMALADEHFSKKIAVSDLLQLKTVKDIVDLLSE